MTTTLVPLGTPFTETLRQLAFNHALNKTRTEKFTRYVDYTGYKTGIKFSFRPHQLVDFKSDLTEMTLTTASKKWDPCGKSNVSTFCQSVGENKRRELIRKFMREHKLEVSATNMGRLLLATGEKVRSTRDWDNDPDEDSASILENLPSGGIGRFQFKAKFAAMDLDEIRKRLTPEEAEVFTALVRFRGNVEAARRFLNEEVYHEERYHRTKFAERTVPTVRLHAKRIYFFNSGKTVRTLAQSMV